MDGNIEILKKGGVGIIPTDTLYGIVGSALSETAVERIYAIRKRDLHKPLIVLISSFADLEKFGVILDEKTKTECEKYWPGPVSIVLPVLGEKFRYLHRGGETVAFRFPKDEKLLALLQETGPLVAPSANPQGLEPAKTIEEAKKYFGDEVDFYEDGGERSGQPSKLIAFEAGEVKILRL